MSDENSMGRSLLHPLLLELRLALHKVMPPSAVDSLSPHGMTFRGLRCVLLKKVFHLQLHPVEAVAIMEHLLTCPYFTTASCSGSGSTPTTWSLRRATSTPW